MRKTLNKFLAFAITATLSVSALCPLTAQAAPAVPESVTVYRSSKSSNYSSSASIHISNLEKSDTIKKSSVKSSNTAVAKLNYLNKDTSKYTYDYKYFESSNNDSTYDYTNYSYNINLKLLKAGTSTISYKIGDTPYSTKVTVKNYENPLKTVKLTGISSGKNIAAKLKKQSSANLKLKKNVKNATLKLASRSNWKITAVYVTNSKKVTQNNSTYYNSQEQYSYYTYGNGKKSVTLRLGALKKANRYQVQVNLTNTKTGGGMTCFYYVN